ncbi:MAG: hypothetical protein HY763_10880 [Planctomycetes bacterium]|nr:hypothetical protein [Planctomycetota bacterium]
MDNKNFAIGVLSTTAVILLVGVVVLQSLPHPAFASGVTASTGEFVATVGTMTINDEELLFIYNTQSERMGIYRYDASQSKIDLVDGIDFKDLNKPGAAPAGGQTAPGKKRTP